MNWSRGGGISSHKIFDEIISLENLFLAWDEFKRGKRNKSDVQEFEYDLEDNIFQLHQGLKTKTYSHSDYPSFYIKDPKLRRINKAGVFVILDNNREKLGNLIIQIDKFLKEKLRLFLHRDKITIRKYHQGVDFLGYVSFPHHRILRTKTKKRIFKKIKRRIKILEQDKVSKESFNQTIQSYFGVLKHCNSYKLKREIENFLTKI